MPENIKPKEAARIGGKGTMRRRCKVKKEVKKSTQGDVLAALTKFKKSLRQVANATTLSLHSEEKMFIYNNPKINVIVDDKDVPVCYIISGKNKSVDLTPKQIPDDNRVDLDPCMVVSGREHDALGD